MSGGVVMSPSRYENVGGSGEMGDLVGDCQYCSIIRQRQLFPQ